MTRLFGPIALVLLAALALACAGDDGRDAPAPEPSAAVTTDDAAPAEAIEPAADVEADTPPAPRAPGSDTSNAAAAETAPAADRTSAPAPDDPPSGAAAPVAVADAAGEPAEEPAGDEGAASEDGAAAAPAADDTPAETVPGDDTAGDAAPADGPDYHAGAARPENAAARDAAAAAPAFALPAATAGEAEEDPAVADLPAPDDPAPPLPSSQDPSVDIAATGVASWRDPTAHLPETAVIVEPPRLLIVLDPGHGGDETGAQAFGLVERESNLDFALRVEVLLVEAGFDVLLTRRTRDRVVDVTEEYPDAPDFVVNRPDLQARVDLANEAGADLFVSIHSNGHDDARASGVEVYWSRERPHAAENQRLALALQESVLESLRVEAGYRAWDRGIREDTCWDVSRWTGECEGLFLLGPATEIQRSRVVALGQVPEALGFAPDEEVLRSRATQMPAALLELLFITNEWEAGVLKNETARQAIAIGIARGIQRYFAETAAPAEAAAGG